MAEGQKQFSYLAIDAAGRRIKAVISAPNEAAAFERLRRDNLSPIRIKAQTGLGQAAGSGTLTDLEVAELLSSLADLLAAGADIRAALSILAGRADRSGLKGVCSRLMSDISGGGALDLAFSQAFAKRHGFVGAFVAAGEASGSLPAGLRRAADLLESQIKLRDQLIATLSYPIFVLISTVAALLAILLFVIPSLAPLVEDVATDPPLILGALITASHAVSDNLSLILAALASILAALIIAARLGWLSGPIDRAVLNGPVRKLARSLIYGRFAIGLGGMLSSGAPITDALRLAIRGTASPTARAHLEPVAKAVREGAALSASLDRVKGFPAAITRLVAVGETSGALGPMLIRSGTLEEATAVRRIEAIGRMAGPILIIVLGGMVGTLMAGLLSGISDLGETALR